MFLSTESPPHSVRATPHDGGELLIVGGDDTPVIEINREAAGRMRAPVELAIVPNATHLFEEPGALEQVSRLAASWCRRYLTLARSQPPPARSAGNQTLF